MPACYGSVYSGLYSCDFNVERETMMLIVNVKLYRPNYLCALHEEWETL
jgi:hypothetical protein